MPSRESAAEIAGAAAGTPPTTPANGGGAAVFTTEMLPLTAKNLQAVKVIMCIVFVCGCVKCVLRPRLPQHLQTAAEMLPLTSKNLQAVTVNICRVSERFVLSPSCL